jgi:hypothetical protein
MDDRDPSPRGKILQKILEKARKKIARSPEHEIDLVVSDSIYESLSGARTPKLREDILTYLRNRAKYVPPLDRLVVHVAPHGPETLPDLANARAERDEGRHSLRPQRTAADQKALHASVRPRVLTFVVKTFVHGFFKNAGVNEIFLSSCGSSSGGPSSCSFFDGGPSSGKACDWSSSTRRGSSRRISPRRRSAVKTPLPSLLRIAHNGATPDD